jgi:predicted RNase H-like HicB family nuclease
VELTVESDREKGGRRIASVPELAGVHIYGESRDQACSEVLGNLTGILSGLHVLQPFRHA